MSVIRTHMLQFGYLYLLSRFEFRGGRVVHIDLELRVAPRAPRGNRFTGTGYVDSLAVPDRRGLVERAKVGLARHPARGEQRVHDSGRRREAVDAGMGDRARDVHDE